MPATDLQSRRAATVRRYLTALGEGDTDTLILLFTPDGEVVSPLYGRLPASAFFTELARTTSVSDLTLMDVLVSTTDSNRLAAHFHYRWVLRNGSAAAFDCCDLFEFAEPADEEAEPLIRLMTIVYDTAPVREVL